MDCSSSRWSVTWGFVFPSSLWEEEKIHFTEIELISGLAF